MADESGSGDREDRTESPTDRRREETRERGSVPRSADLSAAALAASISLALYALADSIQTGLADLLRQCLDDAPWVRLDPIAVYSHFWRLALAAGQIVLPLMATLLAGILAANFAQVGFQITPMAIQPEWSRVNPLSGWGRIFSMQGAVKVGVSLLKLGILGAVAYSFINGRLEQFMSGAGFAPTQLAALLSEALVSLSFQLALALGVIAMLDYGYRLWDFEQNLKMTKQELREEMRMMDGDPHIRQKRKEAHRKLTDARQVQRVGEASALVTNPTEYAVAIRFDEDIPVYSVPVVIAKGTDLLARRMRQAAIQAGVPIVENVKVARALYASTKVGQHIPEDLYSAVAEILAFVMRLKSEPQR